MMTLCLNGTMCHMANETSNGVFPFIALVAARAEDER